MQYTPCHVPYDFAHIGSPAGPSLKGFILDLLTTSVAVGV